MVGASTITLAGKRSGDEEVETGVTRSSAAAVEVGFVGGPKEPHGSCRAEALS